MTAPRAQNDMQNSSRVSETPTNTDTATFVATAASSLVTEDTSYFVTLQGSNNTSSL
jgi:hypothetical protein